MSCFVPNMLNIVNESLWVYLYSRITADEPFPWEIETEPRSVARGTSDFPLWGSETDLSHNNPEGKQKKA